MDNVIDLRTRRPLTEPISAVTPARPTDLPNPMRIGLIEDRAPQADLWRMKLKRAAKSFGIVLEIQWATSSEEAIETFLAWQPHVIVHDLGLAGSITPSDTDTITGSVNLKLFKDLPDLCPSNTVHIVNTRQVGPEIVGPISKLGPHGYLEAADAQVWPEEQLFDFVANLVRYGGQNYSSSAANGRKSWENRDISTPPNAARPVVLYLAATSREMLTALRSGNVDTLRVLLGRDLQKARHYDQTKLNGLTNFTLFCYATTGDTILVGIAWGAIKSGCGSPVKLTPREAEILSEYCPLDHPTRGQIAFRLGTRPRTIDTHVQHVRERIRSVGIEPPVDAPSLARWVFRADPQPELGEAKIVEFPVKPPGRRKLAA